MGEEAQLMAPGPRGEKSKVFRVKLQESPPEACVERSMHAPAISAAQVIRGLSYVLLNFKDS